MRAASQQSKVESRKLRLLAFALLLLTLNCGLSTSASAQFTLVSGTVTDPNGLPWACGTISATLINVNGVSATLNGQVIQGFTAPVKLGCPTDPTTSRTAGAFQMQLADNTVIKCGISACGTQTTWQFTANTTGIAPPQGTGPQSFSNTFTISGTSQTLTFTGVPALSLASAGSGLAPVMGFYLSNADPPGTVNGQRYGTFANTQQANGCAYTSGSPTVTCFGQVAQMSGAVASNVATYTSSGTGGIPSNWAIGNSITVTGFTNADVYLNVTCTLSAVTTTSVSCPLTHANGSSTSLGLVTNSNAGPFVTADNGKRIFGYQSCMNSINLAANNNNNPMTTGAALTLTYVSSTTVTLSANAANTVTQSGAIPNGTTGPGGCVIWGTPDDAAAAAMDVAMWGAPFCPKFHLASANYFFVVPHFFTEPLACLNEDAAMFGGTFSPGGNIVYSSGYELEGRGAGTTVIYMPPGFPESGSCNNGKSKLACWVVVTEGKWSNVKLTGGGNRIAPNVGSGQNIVEEDGPAQIQDAVFTNFGERGTSGTAITNGVGAYLWSQLNHVNLSAFGTNDLATNVTSSVTAIQLWIENFGSTGMNLGLLADYFSQNVSTFSKYNLACYDCTINLESMVDSGTAPFFLVNNGLKVKWYRGAISTQSFPGQTQNNMRGAFSAAAGSVFDFQDMQINLGASGGGTGTGYNAIDCSSFSCTTILENTLLGASSGGTGKLYTDIAGSLFQNRGNVTFAGGSTSGQFSLLGKATALSSESGQVTCSASAATITFVGSYLFNPNVIIQDQTTAGAVTQTSISTTTKVVGCPGASDVLNYTVTPNPI